VVVGFNLYELIGIVVFYAECLFHIRNLRRGYYKFNCVWLCAADADCLFHAVNSENIAGG
jgi:hypothetical protein